MSIFVLLILGSIGAWISLEATHFDLVFLHRILFSLPITASDAFRCRTLVAKGRPRSKVLAPFAPLDLQTISSNNPDRDITSCAKTFVLAGNDMSSAVVIVMSTIVLLDTSPLAHQAGGGAHARLSTHDTVPSAVLYGIGIVRRVASLRQIVREVDEAMKVW